MFKQKGEVGVLFLGCAFVILLLVPFLFINWTVVPDGHEGVVSKKPLFWGVSGTQEDEIATGRHFHWSTTDIYPYNLKPKRFDEKFDDLLSSDNTPVDFKASLEVKQVKGETSTLHREFGADWYELKVQETFKAMLRDFAKSEKLFDLTTNPDTLIKGQKEVLEQLRAYVAAIALPVAIDKVVIGSVTPPEEVLTETAKTAAQNQRVKTEANRKLAEDSREEAERSKARADSAYATEFGMTADQYLQLRSLEIQKELIEVAKDGKADVQLFVSTGEVKPQPMVTRK